MITARNPPRSVRGLSVLQARTAAQAPDNLGAHCLGGYMEWNRTIGSATFFSDKCKSSVFVQEDANTVRQWNRNRSQGLLYTDIWNRAAPASAAARQADRCGEQVAGREESRPPIVAGAPATSALPGKERERIVSGWPLESPRARSGFCQGGTRGLAPSFWMVLTLGGI